MALDFSSSGSLVDYGEPSGLGNAAAFTAWAWVYRTGDGADQVIFSKLSAYPNGWLLLVDNGAGEGQLRFFLFRGSDFATRTEFASAVGTVPLNQWTFVAVSYNEAASPRAKLYKAGVGDAVAEVTYTTQLDGTGSPTGDTGSNIYVGSEEANTALTFKGRIARGGMVNSALNAVTINAIRRESLFGANVAGTRILFDYVTADTNQPDLSGNGNNGTRAVATLAAHTPFFEITTATLPDGAVGVAYSQTLAIANEITSVASATISNNSLPNGLTLDLSGAGGLPRIHGANPTVGNTFNFRVRLVDSDGNVAEKNFTIFITGGGGDTTAPTVPTGLAGTVISTTQINLSWNASTDNVLVTGYDLQRATDSGFTQNLTTINLGNVLNYEDTGRSPNTRYYYRVRAHDAVPNNSAYSSAINRRTLPAWEGTKTFGSAGYQGVAAEGDFVHVITGQFTVGAINYWRSPNEGNTWDIDGVTIANGIPYLEDPLVSSGNNIALFYFKNIVSVFDFVGERFVGELYCIVSTDNGANWGTEQLVSGVVVPGRGLRMSAAWNGNSLHVAWMDFKNVANPLDYNLQTTSWDLYYNRSLDSGATWQTEQRLRISTNKTGINRPAVVCIGNTVHIVTFDGIDDKASCAIDTGSTVLPVCTEVVHQRNENNGAPGNWQTLNQLTNNTAPVLYSGRVNAARIGANKLFISFDRGHPSGNNIFGILSQNDGASFGTEFPIVLTSGVQSHSAPANNNGITHIVWGDRVDTALYYKQSGDDTATFGATETALAGSIVGLVGTSENYIHVVGFVGSTGTYKRRFLPPPPPPDSTPPTVPQNLSVNSNGLNALLVSWNASTDDESGVAGYDLQRATDSGFTQNLLNLNLGNVINYNDTSVSTGVVYFYRVRAYDAAAIPNQSAYSTGASGQTGITPVSGFTPIPIFGNAPLVVRFFDGSTNNPTSWAWNFGDGTTSTAQSPGKTYAAPGAYLATLAASNAGGAGSIASTYIYVGTYPTAFIGILYSRYYAHPIDWKEVTISHEYEDGGRSFNEVSNDAPRRWDIEYNGLSPDIADLFEQFYNAYRFAKKFAFTDKLGVTHQNVQIEAFANEHEAHKSWIKNVSFRLVKFS